MGTVTLALQSEETSFASAIILLTKNIGTLLCNLSLMILIYSLNDYSLIYILFNVPIRQLRFANLQIEG